MEQPFPEIHRLFNNAEERQESVEESIRDLREMREGLKKISLALKEAKTIEEFREKLGLEPPEEAEK